MRSKYNWVSRAKNFLFGFFFVCLFCYLYLDLEFKVRSPTSYLVWPAIQLPVCFHQITSVFDLSNLSLNETRSRVLKPSMGRKSMVFAVGHVCGKSASTLKAGAVFSLDFGNGLQLLALRSDDAIFCSVGTPIIPIGFCLQIQFDAAVKLVVFSMSSVYLGTALQASACVVSSSGMSSDLLLVSKPFAVF